MRLNAPNEGPQNAALTGQVSVDLSAISDNIRTLRQRSAATHFMAVVKGNAYGHGLV
jgi:alanine racemase